MSETAETKWHPVSTAPFDRDLELAVADQSDFHALVFRCRRVHQGWINGDSGKRLDIHPTHWRDWPR
jgi:hypothetical protein